MKSWMMVLGALAVVGSGCSPIELDPLEKTEDPGAPIVLGTNVIAIRGGDVNWNDNFAMAPQSGKFWSSPDARVLFFSGDAQECSDPVLAGRCSGAPFWQTILAIPPELDLPGVIDLQDPRVLLYSVMTVADGSPNCGGGGMVVPLSSVPLAGTLEIISDGPTSLTVKVRNVASINGVALDGDYTAEICGSGSP